MSEHLKQIHKTIKTLSSADKIVFTGVMILVLGLFFPWFSINVIDIIRDKLSTTFIAFTGVTYIVGYLCYLLGLLSLHTIGKNIVIATASLSFVLFLLNDPSLSLFDVSMGAFYQLLPTFVFLIINVIFIFSIENINLIKKKPKYTINIFAGVESLILIFVASMIYHRYAINYTDASLNFGLYISAIGAGLILYGGYAQYLLQKKRETKSILSNPSKELHGGIKLKPDLSIDTSENKQNNTQEQKNQSQLSLGDYE